MLFLLVVLVLNLLVWFIQRWSIRVRSRVQYESAPALERGTFAYVTPHLHQGAAAIVPVQEVQIRGRTHRFFIYQRQKYEIDDSCTVVSELAMPDKEPLQHYQQHRGYASAEELQHAVQR